MREVKKWEKEGLSEEVSFWAKIADDCYVSLNERDIEEVRYHAQNCPDCFIRVDKEPEWVADQLATQKLRRQIEDRLRKSPKEVIRKVADFLGM
jgi:hypothetical protein